MKGLPLLGPNWLTPLLRWLRSFVSSACTHLVRFVASHSLQPLSPSAMALGMGCPGLAGAAVWSRGAGELGPLLVKLQVRVWLPP